MKMLRRGRIWLVAVGVSVLLVLPVGGWLFVNQFHTHGSAATLVADAFMPPSGDSTRVVDPTGLSDQSSDDSTADCGPAPTDSPAPAAHLASRLGCPP